MFNKTVRNYLGLDKTSGQIGIEVEMETSDSIYRDAFGPVWRVENDGSLRGYGQEFVLQTPCNMDQVEDVLALVTSGLKKQRVSIQESIRAGVHIHLNMQENPVNDVFKLLGCYYLMETALTRFCGEGREGNLFCLRGRDATYAIDCATEAYKATDLYGLRTQSLRYSSLNVQSLFQYGSVEFRGLGTTKDLSNIKIWCMILMKLKEYATKVKNPWDNIMEISGVGGRQWMTNIFGEELMEHLDYPDLEWDIIQDTRNAQFFCHAISGEFNELQK